MSGNGRKVSLYLSEKGGTVTAVEGDYDSCCFHPITDEAVKAALFKPRASLLILEGIRAGNPE